MDLRSIVHVASKQSVKLEAAKMAGFSRVLAHEAKSGVSEQPMGMSEIKLGALNRLNCVKDVLPVISYESGLVFNKKFGTGETSDKALDVTHVMLRTNVGTFQTTVKHTIRSTALLVEYFQSEEFYPNKTFGSFLNEKYKEYASKLSLSSVMCCVPNDWYMADDAEQPSRIMLLAYATHVLVTQYETFMKSLPALVIPAPLKTFKGVEFLDIQYPLMHHPKLLADIAFHLTRNLLFNKVVVMDARGFLLAGRFMEHKYPIIMARKAGKLPSEETSITYEKEYGTDTICISKGLIKADDKVIILDDVIATGGTMKAVASLIESCGAQVVAYVAPYAVTRYEVVDRQNSTLHQEKKLLCQNIDIVSKIRYLCDQIEANYMHGLETSDRQVDKDILQNKNKRKNKIESHDSVIKQLKWSIRTCIETQHESFQTANFKDSGSMNCKYIFPPSLLAYDTQNLASPVQWGQFARSSNIWFSINPNNDSGSGKKCTHLVFFDPSNREESFDMLQLLSILHRKDVGEVIVVIPFLEQATQDRVEYKSEKEIGGDKDGEFESLACVDTIGKLLGTHKVFTFDLHAEQSRFAFHDLRYDSLVAHLWKMYQEHHPEAIVVFPDEGACKRYGKICTQKDDKNQFVEPIVFRKIRSGDKRIVSTDDEITPTHYVIIDDMVRGGGTMNACARHLLNKGALAVDALFAHAPLEPSASVNMSIIRECWTTDTCLNTVPRDWVKIHIYDYILSKFAN